MTAKQFKEHRDPGWRPNVGANRTHLGPRASGVGAHVQVRLDPREVLLQDLVGDVAGLVEEVVKDALYAREE